MKLLREWGMVLLVLMCILSLFLGYFWRMYHETKNWDQWRYRIVSEFITEVEQEKINVFYFDRWQFIKRADGSVVMKRR